MQFVILIFQFLSFVLSADSQILVTIVSHNEVDDARYSLYDTLQGYTSLRNALLNMTHLFMKYNASYDFEPDWRMLEAAKLYENGPLLVETNGKTLFKYFEEDLGIAIDAHSHETEGYNYADVANLIVDQGVNCSDVVGGYIGFSDNPQEITWEQFRNEMTGTKYGKEWKFNAMWGQGTKQHQGTEYHFSGIYRPKGKTTSEFFEDDASKNLVNIGACSSQTNFVTALNDLVDYVHTQGKGGGKLYTLTMMSFEYSVLTNSNQLNVYESQIQAVQSFVQQGKVKWATLEEVVKIWKEEFGSTPNYYCCPGNDYCEQHPCVPSCGEPGDSSAAASWAVFLFVFFLVFACVE